MVNQEGLNMHEITDQQLETMRQMVAAYWQAEGFTVDVTADRGLDGSLYFTPGEYAGVVKIDRKVWEGLDCLEDLRPCLDGAVLSLWWGVRYATPGGYERRKADLARWRSTC